MNENRSGRLFQKKTARIGAFLTIVVHVLIDSCSYVSRYLSPIRVAEQLRVVEKSKCLPNSAHNRSYSHHHHAPCNSRLPLARRYRLPSLLHH